MKSKLFLCAALAAALYVTPSYAADYSAQVVSFSQEDPDNLSIELTGSKVITDDFSFKLPSQAFSKLIMVPSGDSYEYMKKQPMKPTEADFSSAFSHLRTRITAI